MSVKPAQHFLQSAEWATLKTKHTPWELAAIEVNDQSVHVFRRKTKLGIVNYIPGVAALSTQELKQIGQAVEQLSGRNLVCKLEPCTEFTEAAQTLYKKAGWRPTRNIQPSYTIRLNLKDSEEAIMAQMKKRARTEIRKAVLNGCSIEEVQPNEENLHTFYKLLAGTASRQHFTVREKAFMLDFWKSFAAQGHLRLFFAKYSNKIIAGATIITSADGRLAWYKDGASVAEKAQLLGSRLMLWEVARALKQDGFEQFDLGGIPDPATYEQSHMKGIYIFKVAYSQTIFHYLPAFELPLNKLAYKLWPKYELLQLKRARGRSEMWY